jgi:hypothetical protein
MRLITKEVKCAVIAPDNWLSALDIVRYGPARAQRLCEDGLRAAQQTFQRIERLGWDSLYHIDDASNVVRIR